MVLRRIAYTLLSLWRSVTLRSERERGRPWSAVMGDVEFALINRPDDQTAVRAWRNDSGVSSGSRSVEVALARADRAWD